MGVDIIRFKAFFVLHILHHVMNFNTTRVFFARPKKLVDAPQYTNLQGNGKEVRYSEGSSYRAVSFLPVPRFCI